MALFFINIVYCLTACNADWVIYDDNSSRDHMRTTVRKQIKSGNWFAYSAPLIHRSSCQCASMLFVDPDGSVGYTFAQYYTLFTIEIRYHIPRSYHSFLECLLCHCSHNEHDDVSNYRHLDCLLNCLFRRRSKKTSKLRVTGLCEGIHRTKVQ